MSTGQHGGPYAPRVYAPGPYARPSRQFVDRGAQYDLGQMQYAPTPNVIGRMPGPHGPPD